MKTTITEASWLIVEAISLPNVAALTKLVNGMKKHINSMINVHYLTSMCQNYRIHEQSSALPSNTKLWVFLY